MTQRPVGRMLIASSLLLCACAQQQDERVVTLVVSNMAAYDAMGVVDGISLNAVCDSLGVDASTPLTVRDAHGNVVSTQRFNNGEQDLLLFESHTLANDESTYTVEVGRPDSVFASSVSVGCYPIHKDDLTWENASSIWRAYGPEYNATVGKASGYDIWCKNTAELMAEKRYQLYAEGYEQADSLQKLGMYARADSLLHATSLQENHGDGLDAYSADGTLGGGTAALIDNGKIAYPGCYRKYEILAKGPLLAAFKLSYDTTCVAGDTLVEHRTIVTQKGSRFNIINVRYEGLRQQLPVAVGIAFHGDQDSIRLNTEGRYICYSDPSDKRDSAEGRILVGVYSPSLSKTSLELGHLLATSEYQPGETFTYYMGAGWSRGDCPTLDVMEEELRQMSEAPRTVRIVVK